MFFLWLYNSGSGLRKPTAELPQSPLHNWSRLPWSLDQRSSMRNQKSGSRKA